MTDGLVCPGDKLSQAVGHTAGKGTYVKGLHICAAILGKIQLIPPSQDSTDQQKPCKTNFRVALVAECHCGGGSRRRANFST
eukprot:1190124-Prorocentrum_minimum.AAC.2